MLKKRARENWKIVRSHEPDLRTLIEFLKLAEIFRVHKSRVQTRDSRQMGNFPSLKRII
jgi:hypothetical protein